MIHRESERTELRVVANCLVTLTVLAVGAGLALLKPVLVPFVLAVLVTYCLTPVVDFLVRTAHFPQPLAVLGATLVGLAVLLGLGLFVASLVGDVSQNFAGLQARLTEFIERYKDRIQFESFGLHFDADTGKLVSLTGDASGRLVRALARELTDIVSDGSLVLIFMAFLLLGRNTSGAVPTGFLAEIEYTVRRFLLSMFTVSAVTGLLVGGTLFALGVPYSGMFGFLAFLLNFIPTIGSVVATLLPVPVVLLSPELSPLVKVLAIAIPGVLQIFLGNLVQPKLVGDSQGLHPVTIVLALLFFGMIWGVGGTILAVPLTAVARLVLERIESTRPVAALLAGRLDALAQWGEQATEKELP
ncbi:MAG: AI-2E family transporter [Gemmataceae bacterium]